MVLDGKFLQEYPINAGAIGVKMDGSFFEEKTSFKMLGQSFSSKLNLGSYIVSIDKTASKKIGSLIHSKKFFTPEVVFYLYKSTIWPCMEYCFHAWAGAPSCHLGILNYRNSYVALLVLDLRPLLNP